MWISPDRGIVGLLLIKAPRSEFGSLSGGRIRERFPDRL